MIKLVADISANARQWRNDERIWKWCRQNGPISEGHHEEWLDRIENDPTIKMFGIQHYSSPSELGVCGLTSINRLNQSAEFSLYIAPSSQGKGYGRQALLALFKHGFHFENLNRIWGEVFDGNPALKMFEQIGMKKEGTLRQSYFRGGKFIDTSIVGMLREDWDLRTRNQCG